MALEIKLSQKLSQSLVMTPQLQQAIKLLQLGRLEYVEMIEKELLENPVLEDVRELLEGAEGGAAQVMEGSVSTNSSPNPESAEIPSQQPGELNSNNETSLLGGYSDDFDNYSDMSGSVRRTNNDEERPPLEATVSRPEGLATHVCWQLRTSDLQECDHEIAMHIIGNVDRNGYLSASLEELAESCGRDLCEVERVLRVIQTLDPPGIGARDLRECLLIQLEQLGLGDSLAARIVSKHLDKLETRRYDLIAREEKIELGDIYDAIREIQKLEPRPGRPFIDESPIYITPDIYVRKVGDDYVTTLNEAGMPKLRLSPRYRELLSGSKGQENAYKEYLQDRVRSAAWLIKSVHQRQQTIFKVTESIMRFQREFLEHGVAAMKPLVLREIAEEVGMHESTVSRVTTNKYVHTPQGVYELKFFFSSGLKSGAGEVSSESVKDRIKSLVSAEDERRPLSDQQLVNILRAEGIDIARRTVAKYREMLNILSSSRRKKVF